MTATSPRLKFGEFLRPNSRPYTLGPDEDANLVGMRLYGKGPFHREFKTAMRIAKKTHFVVRKGDVIYNKLFAWKGTFGIVPGSLDGMYVSDKFPTYELNREAVDEDFLRWYMRHPALWEEARTMSTGSAALSKLTLNPPKFLLLTMPVPPLAEQRRVVRRIEELANKIGEARALTLQCAAQVAAITRSMLDHLCRDINSSGILRNVLKAPPRNGWSAKCDNADAGVPVLSLAAVTGFQYRSSEFKRTSLWADPDGHFWLRPGDLLITRSNTPELVGHAAIYDGQPFPCVYPDLMMRLDVDQGAANPRFVWYWLQTPVVREFIRLRAKGTSPTMKKISQGTVSAIPYPTALSLSAQKRIVDELDSLHVMTQQAQALQVQSGSELDAFLPAVLDLAFRGELL
jgi:type I restriction enzyme S subunit